MFEGMVGYESVDGRSTEDLSLLHASSSPAPLSKRTATTPGREKRRGSSVVGMKGSAPAGPDWRRYVSPVRVGDGGEEGGRRGCFGGMTAKPVASNRALHHPPAPASSASASSGTSRATRTTVASSTATTSGRTATASPGPLQLTRAGVITRGGVPVAAAVTPSPRPASNSGSTKMSGPTSRRPPLHDAHTNLRMTHHVHRRLDECPENFPDPPLEAIPPSPASSSPSMSRTSASTDSSAEIAEVIADVTQNSDATHPSDEEPSQQRPAGACTRNDSDRASHLLLSMDQHFPTPPRRRPSSAGSSAVASSSSSSRRSAPVDLDEIDDQEQMEDQKHLEAMNRIASVHVQNGEYKLALEVFKAILNAHTRRHGAVHPLVASTHHNIGVVHIKHSKLLRTNGAEGRNQAPHSLALALESFQSAARVARDSMGKDHPNVAVSLVRIGFILLECGQYLNALVTFREALRVRVSGLGPDHPDVAKVHNNMGVSHLHLGQYGEGKGSFEKALNVQLAHVASLNTTKETTGQSLKGQVYESMLEVADTLCNIGSLCLDWHEKGGGGTNVVEDAENVFAEALKTRMRILGPSHAQTVHTRTMRDLARTKLGKTTPSPVPSVAKNQFGGVTSTGKKVPGDENNLLQQACILPSESVEGIDSYDVVPTGSTANLTQATPAEQLAAPRKEKAKIWISPHFLQKHRNQHKTVSTAFSVTPSPDEKQERGRNSIPSVASSSASTSSRSSDGCELGEENALSIPNGSRNQSLHSRKSYRPDIAVGPVSRSSQTAEKEQRTHLLSGAQHSDRSQHQHKIESTLSLQPQRPSLPPPPISSEEEDFGSPALKLGHESMYQSPESERQIMSPSSQFVHDDEGLVMPVVSNAPTVDEGQITEEEMLKSPDLYQRAIHDAAARYLVKNNFTRALHLFDVLLQSHRKKYGELHDLVGSALHNIGVVYLRAERHFEALDAFERAVRVRKGAIGKEHPDVAVSLVKVGIVQLLLQRFDEALLSFREALSIRRHALGHLHPSTARVYNNIGCVHVEFGEMKEARRAFEAALDVQRNALCDDPENGPLMFGAATTLCNLGYLYKFRDMHEKAALVLREALALQECVLGRNHPTVLSTLDKLADANARSGDCAEALRCYSEILTRFRDAETDTKNEPPGSHKVRRKSRATAVVLYKMSRLHRRQNDFEATLQKLREALDAVKEINAGSTDEKSEVLVKRIEKEISKIEKEMEQTDLDWV